MHTLELTPRLRIVADEDPEPTNPREDAETAVGVYVPLDYWFNTIPEVHRFPGNIQRAHDVLAHDDPTLMPRVERWAWIFHNIAVVNDGLRYWFAEPDAFRALVSDDLSREHQREVVDQERGAWFQYVKEPAWVVWLERRATFRRTSKHWVAGMTPLMHVWERVSDRCGSLYFDASFIDTAIAEVAKENFGGLLNGRERAAVEAIVDAGRGPFHE